METKFYVQLYYRFHSEVSDWLRKYSNDYKTMTKSHVNTETSTYACKYSRAFFTNQYLLEKYKEFLKEGEPKTWNSNTVYQLMDHYNVDLVEKYPLVPGRDDAMELKIKQYLLVDSQVEEDVASKYASLFMDAIYNSQLFYNEYINISRNVSPTSEKWKEEWTFTLLDKQAVDFYENYKAM